MKTKDTVATVGAIAAALVAPPVATYLLGSAMSVPVFDLFITVFTALVFVLTVALLRPGLASAITMAIVFFPLMFVVIFWMGYSAGYRDMP